MIWHNGECPCDYSISPGKMIVEGNVEYTVLNRIKNDISVKPFLVQVRQMALLAKNAGLNIDYFPTNFVVQNGLLYYIDYECNNYTDEWNFENWGIKYWSKTSFFMEHLNSRQ